MMYKEAMAIGNVLDGIIKCTWATIYDAEGNKVFTLQNRNFSKMYTSTTTYYEGKESSVNRFDDIDLNLAFTQDKVFESVVTCRRFVDGYRVPVTINANVLNVIKKAADRRRENRDKLLDTIEQYPTSFAANIARQRLYETERRDKQITDIEAGKEFWVKVKAFEWYPLNTQNVSLEVQQAESDLKRAKQLLAVSAVATVI